MMQAMLRKTFCILLQKNQNRAEQGVGDVIRSTLVLEDSLC